MDHYDVTAGTAVKRLPADLRRFRRADDEKSWRKRASHSTARADEGLRTTGSALAWLDAEWPNLVAAVVASQDHPSSQNRAVSLALHLTPYFDLRKHWDDWLLSHEVAAHAAERLGLAQHRSHLLREIGRAYHQQGLPEEALVYYREAVDAWPSRKGHRRRETVSLMYRALSELEKPQQLSDEGIAALRSVLEQCELPLGHRRSSDAASGVAAILNNLGVIEARHGNDRQALDCHERAVEHSRRAADEVGEGRSLLHLGNVQLLRGDPRAALGSYRKAFRVFPAEYPFGRALAAYNLGLASAASGDVRETRHWLGPPPGTSRRSTRTRPGTRRAGWSGGPGRSTGVSGVSSAAAPRCGASR